MTQLKEMDSTLTTFAEAITSELPAVAAPRFQPMVTQSLFTDGWMIPMCHCRTVKELHRFLRARDLDVVMPVGATKKGHAWISIDDGPQVLDYTLQQLSQAMADMRNQDQ